MENNQLNCNKRINIDKDGWLVKIVEQVCNFDGHISHGSQREEHIVNTQYDNGQSKEERRGKA